MTVCMHCSRPPFLDVLIATPCLQRHSISRLPDTKGEKLDKKRFKSYPIGYFHIDIAEIQSV
jgi:hypothetical protein